MTWLWWREVLRFFRQPNRVVGALATPMLFWLVIGSGFGGSFRGASYLGYLYPGSAVLILLFAAIFSTISIIEDRREGFLQGVLASPIHRSAIVLAKVLGGVTVATLQAGLFLALAPAAGVTVTVTTVGLALAAFVATSFAMTGLGLLMAWKMESTQGFHAVMNLFLMPMWMLSGALFPIDTAPAWVRAAAAANPLHYGYRAVESALRGEVAVAGFGVVAGFGLVMLIAGTALASARD